MLETLVMIYGKNLHTKNPVVSKINLIIRDGGKWWSKDHHLVVIKILKNVDFSLTNVKKW